MPKKAKKVVKKSSSKRVEKAAEPEETVEESEEATEESEEAREEPEEQSEEPSEEKETEKMEEAMKEPEKEEVEHREEMEEDIEVVKDEPKEKRSIRILPYTFMVLGLSALSLFLVSGLLIWMPYNVGPEISYILFIILSVILGGVSYWAITHSTDSAHATAWGGVLTPILPLAAIMFIQRVFLELAQRRGEIQAAIDRPIPDLFAPLFNAVYPLPVVLAIGFYFFFSIFFFILLLRKKAKAAWLFLLTPVIFITLWFLLQPLVNQVVLAWVTYFKSL
ncbi:hypothetical protein J4457_02595 [Candidatus Woesearchaeota archaeon]|nr:hypothetical protein [Candidatus Woesearchaeota archaeon]